MWLVISRRRLSLPSCLSPALVLVVSALSVSTSAAQTVGWDANTESNLAGYILAYGTQPGSSATTIDVGNVTARAVTGLQGGVTYYFRVRAYNTSGEQSGPSNEVAYTVPAAGDTTPPTAPTSLAATATSSTQIALSWAGATDNVGIAGYTVERCTGSGCSNFAQIGTSAGAAYSSTGLTASTTYRYRVRAVDAANNVSAYSPIATATTTAAPDTTAPTAPSSLVATASSSSRIVLNWSAATDSVGVTEYRIERCTGSGCASFAQIGTATTTSYTNTGLTASTTYRYRVRAVDAASNVGPYSGIATATTPAGTDTTAPSAPTSLAASASSSSQVALSWSAATDNVAVANYRIESCVGATCTNFAQIGTSTTTGYTHTGLTASTAYRYRVRAADAAGNVGPYSSIATATTSGSSSSSCPCTIWPASATPTTASWNDTSAIEVGVKFRTTVAGFITGVRFYKGAQNTGTHVGSLWTASGTRLANATFTGETSSGWQQVSFATPVPVAANTTYVASYYAPVGRYAATSAAFGSTVTSGPLQALSNATANGNGVYKYGASGFPNASYNSTNYWVDVVFNTTTAAPQTMSLSAQSATTFDAADAAPSTTALTVPSDVDADGDGLPDAWEKQYGLAADVATGNDGPSGDPDADGISNLDEYRRDSHPRGVVHRYLAEGLTGADVNTHLWVTNADALEATVLLSFLSEKGHVTNVPLKLAAGDRQVVDTRAIPAVANTAFATTLESDQHVELERHMEWATGATTTAAAVEAAATRWYFAMGSTSDPLELFYLVQNPGDAPADVQVRYLLPGGRAPITKLHTVAAQSRLTIWVDDEVRALAGADVAAEIISLNDAPIVVERAMYSVAPGQSTPADAETGAGLTSPAAEWTLAAADHPVSIVVANPGAEAASVRVTTVFDGGRRAAKTYAVPAGGRVHVDVTSGDADRHGNVRAVEVRSLNGASVIVEGSASWR
jgi:chitodextrinase